MDIEKCSNTECNRREECRRYDFYYSDEFTFTEQSDGFHDCAAFLPKRKTLDDTLKHMRENFTMPKEDEETAREKSLRSLRGLKLNFSYDEVTDVIEIEGVKYCGEYFRNLGVLPLGTNVRIVSREDGVLTVCAVPDKRED